MKLIKASLILNEEVDQDAKRNTDTQTGSVDERIHFAFGDVSRCDFEVIADHNILTMIVYLKKLSRVYKFSFLFMKS